MSDQGPNFNFDGIVPVPNPDFQLSIERKSAWVSKLVEDLTQKPLGHLNYALAVNEFKNPNIPDAWRRELLLNLMQHMGNSTQAKILLWLSIDTSREYTNVRAAFSALTKLEAESDLSVAEHIASNLPMTMLAPMHFVTLQYASIETLAKYLASGLNSAMHEFMPDIFDEELEFNPFLEGEELPPDDIFEGTQASFAPRNKLIILNGVLDAILTYREGEAAEIWRSCLKRMSQEGYSFGIESVTEYAQDHSDLNRFLYLVGMIRDEVETWDTETIQDEDGKMQRSIQEYDSEQTDRRASYKKYRRSRYDEL